MAALRVIPGHQKISIGALGGSLALVLTWLVNSVWDVTIPAEVASALGTLFGLIGVYFMPETYHSSEKN